MLLAVADAANWHKKTMTMRGTTTTLLAYTLVLTGRSNAAISPATSNCVDQNFTDATVYEPDGGQYGICIFSNTTACEEWTFLRGQCDTSHLNFDSFCSENGGQVTQEDVDWGEVEGAPAAQYDVCTVDDGVMCTDYDYYHPDGNCTMMKEGESSEVVTPPDNDECLNATVISTENIGQVQSGSVTGATLDEWSIACSFLQVPPGNGVWYVIKGIEAGTNLQVTCSGMECMLMRTNSSLGECPSTFLCAGAWVGGENNELRYQFTAEEEGIYYVYIAPKQFVPGPLYTVVVAERTEPPTPAPTELLTSPPAPTAAAGRTSMGALFHIFMFAAFYFLA